MEKTISPKVKLFLGIILIVLIIFSLYYIFLKEKEKYDGPDQLSGVKEMHYPELPIKYHINISFEKTRLEKYVKEIGRVEKVMDIRKAFNIIEDSTEGIVYFEEVYTPEEADINLIGFSPTIFEVVTSLENITDVDGALGFAVKENTSNVVINSTVYFLPQLTSFVEYSWIKGRCSNFPQLEIHEILHTFGFGHLFESHKQLMFPLALSPLCPMLEIDDATINCLKYIYSNGTIKGDCSKLNIHPYKVEEQDLDVEDFAWENLPVNYSFFNCPEEEMKRINYAIKIFEKQFGKDFFTYNENADLSKINFICKEDAKEEKISPTTDFWGYRTSPAINSEFVFEDKIISQADISLIFYSNCAGKSLDATHYEMLAIYRAIGLQKRYGSDMDPPSSDCNQIIGTSSTTWKRIKELYELDTE